jgi:hypothetical protein
MIDSRSDAGSRGRLRLVLTALLLLMSCSDWSATAPAATSATLTRTDGPRPIFVVEPTAVTVPTYDGSGQAVHPDVVQFDSDWHGAKYWLTMTPYPKSDQKLENPSILSSADGVEMTIPAGVKNPIVAPPKNSKNYNSDPELLYESQTDRLVLFYRFVERKTNTLRMSVSRDGLTWTSMPAPFWERSHNAVSPTIAPRAGRPARMWYVVAGKAGCAAKSTQVVSRAATDAIGRIVETKWSNPVVTDLEIPGYAIWHIKSRWIEAKQEYWMLISAFPKNANGCHTDDLFFAKSTDGLHWTTYAEPILRHEDREWTASAVYRSSFLYDANSDVLSLWMSAQGSDGAWHLGFARARYAELEAKLVAGERVTPSPSTTFTALDSRRGEQP